MREAEREREREKERENQRDKKKPRIYWNFANMDGNIKTKTYVKIIKIHKLS